MMIQSLERRMMLSVTDYLSGGALVIQTNDFYNGYPVSELNGGYYNQQGDVIVVRYVDCKIKISVNGFFLHQYSEKNVTSINAYLGCGNDTLRILGEQGDGDNEPLTVYGDDGDDIIQVNTHNNSFIFGEDGWDIIITSGGTDMIFGGDGNDNIRAGGGNDFVSGGDDDDIIKGGNGADVLNGDWGCDDLYGEGGNDVLIGGFGFDRGFGGAGAYDSADASTEQFFQTL